MQVRVLYYWDWLRSSYWFLPSTMAIAAVGLSAGMVWLDGVVDNDIKNGFQLVYTGSADGARSMLATIAGSMITVAGVIFSLTMVTLSLASSQFGPRLLRNFMRDVGTQFVLGTFVATYLYCLLVLRTVRSVEELKFVPHLSVTVGVVLATLSLGVLIYFIHHVSVSIQADHVIAAVSHELREVIDRLFPEKLGEGKDPVKGATGLPVGFDVNAQPIVATGDGYIQGIDPDLLLSAANKADIVMRLERRPGDYLAAGTIIARVWPGDTVDDVAKQVNQAFVLGTQRTPTQDLRFAINQVVEVAVRALSPGVNDPFTAITCIDRLSSSLSRLAERAIPSPYRADASGRLRVVVLPPTFVESLAAAVDPLRLYGRTSLAVTLKLLDALETVARRCHQAEYLDAIERQAAMIERGCKEGLDEEEDRHRVRDRYGSLREEIGRIRSAL